MNFYSYADAFIGAGRKHGAPDAVIVAVEDILEKAKRTLPYTAPEGVLERAVGFKTLMMNAVAFGDPRFKEEPWFKEMHMVFMEVRLL